jgi:phenylalanyl-tRNA synthetase alpha chain
MNQAKPVSERDPVEIVEEVGRACRQAIMDAPDATALQRVRHEVLGRHGRIAALMDMLQTAPKERRRDLGLVLNRTKGELTALYDQRAEILGQGAAKTDRLEDITLPGRVPLTGALHPLTKMERRVVRVLESLGFEVTEGPEIEDEFHNFIALNIPPGHPARDESENFYLQDGHHLLRSQTSTVQIRALESRKPPFRVMAPGRVFRPDEVDATHHFMFHQVEGLAVDRGLTMCDLKATLVLFFRGLFGEDVELRLRPSFFPFTEPSAEVDVKFPGRGWVEAGGSGMVDPAVFHAVGLDPEEWSGFAFGLGLERMGMRHYEVPDIRLFTENDARFLRQLD